MPDSVLDMTIFAGGQKSIENNLQTARYRAINSSNDQILKDKKDKEKIYRLSGFQGDLDKVSMGIASGGIKEGSIEESNAYSSAITTQIDNFKSQLKNSDLSSEDRNKILGKELPVLMQQQAIFANTAIRQSGYGLSRSASQLAAFQGMDIGAIVENRTGTISAYQESLQTKGRALGARKNQLESQGSLTEDQQQELANIKQQQNQIRVEYKNTFTLQYDAQMKLKQIETSKRQVDIEYNKLTGASINEQKDRIDDLISSLKDQHDIQDKISHDPGVSENKKREATLNAYNLSLQEKQLEVEKKRLSLSSREIGFGGTMARLGLGGGAYSAQAGDIERKNYLNSKEMTDMEKTDTLLKQRNDEERKTLDVRLAVIDSYDAERSKLEAQQHLLSNRVSMYQSLGMGVQAAKVIRESITGDQGILTSLLNQFTATKNDPNLPDPAKADRLLRLQSQISDKQLEIVNKYNIQRRTLAEQESANVINMPNGSYINPSSMSGFGMLGSGYFTGSSMYGNNRPNMGTYQTQVAARFGGGMDERSPVEQFLGVMLGGATDLKSALDGLNINIQMPDANGVAKGVINTNNN